MAVKIDFNFHSNIKLDRGILASGVNSEFATGWGEPIANTGTRYIYTKKLAISNLLKLLLRKLPVDKKVIKRKKELDVLMKKHKRLCVNKYKLFENKNFNKYDKKIDKLTDKIIKIMEKK